MSDTPTLIAAMRILARDIQSDDGVANAAIAEAADRLEEMQSALQAIEQHEAGLCGESPPYTYTKLIAQRALTDGQ